MTWTYKAVQATQPGPFDLQEGSDVFEDRFADDSNWES